MSREYWKTYFASDTSPSTFTLRQCMNGYVPSCSTTFSSVSPSMPQNVSSASFTVTFFSDRFFISRKNFGPFITQSSMCISSEYHIAEREPGAK